MAQVLNDFTMQKHATDGHSVHGNLFRDKPFLSADHQGLIFFQATLIAHQNLHIHMHSCTCEHVRSLKISTCTKSMHIHMHAGTCPRRSKHAQTHARMHVCTDTHTGTRTHARTHARTHVSTCTHLDARTHTFPHASVCAHEWMLHTNGISHFLPGIHQLELLARSDKYFSTLGRPDRTLPVAYVSF